ncbi:MAG: hypothetical protein HOO96_15045 [Polyangiaceae bacterium]|nr:hypothetical protein [Polyangiaceae bacterium]
MASDFPICGTARLAMDRLRAGSIFDRARRLHAQGHLDRAAAEYEEALRNAISGSETSPSLIRAYWLRLAQVRGDGARVATLQDQLRGDLALNLEDARRRVADAGQDVMFRARARVKLAVWLGAAGCDAEAEGHLRHAIAELGALWGPEHMEVLSFHDELATNLFFQGRAAEAQPHTETT